VLRQLVWHVGHRIDAGPAGHRSSGQNLVRARARRESAVVLCGVHRRV